MGTHNYPAVALAATEARLAELDAANLPADIDYLLNELEHRSYLFPDLSTNIDLICQFTSGAIDSFGTWAEIQDDTSPTPITLTSLAASNALHISALRIRSTSDADLLYVIEFGYGPDTSHVTIFDSHDFGSGTKKIDSDEVARFRASTLPAGQHIYYRMKTENTLNATADITLRYHYD